MGDFTEQADKMQTLYEREQEQKRLTEAPLAPVQPTNGREAPPKREPVARVLLAEVKLVVGLSDEDGIPQGPFNILPVTFTHADPENRGRTLLVQIAEHLPRSEARVVEEWRKQNAVPDGG